MSKKNSTGKFVLGAAIGAAIGLLFSPRTGKENRRIVKEKADDFVSTGTDLYKNRGLFDKDAKGNYDMDEIVEEIGAFIKDYNDLMIGAENTKSSGISSAIKTLEGITSAYQKDLKELGLAPSPKYAEILDYVLKLKLENPDMTKKEEIDAVKKYLTMS